MAARVRHVYTVFGDDATNPVQLIAREVRQSMDSWNFSVTKRFL